VPSTACGDLLGVVGRCRARVRGGRLQAEARPHAAKHGAPRSTRSHGEGDEYGTPTAESTVPERATTRIRLERFDSTTDAALDNVRFAGHYAAFEQTLSDVACGKYDPSNPLCTSHGLLSFNLAQREAPRARRHRRHDARCS